jgi:hypothetical protein
MDWETARKNTIKIKKELQAVNKRLWSFEDEITLEGILANMNVFKYQR